MLRGDATERQRLLRSEALFSGLAESREQLDRRKRRLSAFFRLTFLSHIRVSANPTLPCNSRV